MSRPTPYFLLDLIALDAMNDVGGELRQKLLPNTHPKRKR